MNLSNLNRYDVLFQEYNEKKQRMLQMLSMMFDNNAIDEFWAYGSKISKDSFMNPSRDNIPDLNYVRKYLHHDNMLKFLNTEYWKRVIDETGVMDYVSSSVKQQWRDSLQKHDMPNFEMETVKSALAGLFQELPKLFKQRLQDAHSVISKGHKTNSAEMFNKRMIFTVASFDHRWSMYGVGDFFNRECDAINDIRSTISQLNGGQQIKGYDTQSRLAMIAKSGNWGEWVKIDEHVAVRLYKVGTCHLEIRPEIADMLNSVIADGTIPNMSESWYQKKKDKPVKEFHDMSQVMLSNDELIGLDRVWSYKHKRDLSIEYILERIDNQFYYDDGYHFSYDIKPVIDYIRECKMIPDYKTHQYYPTPKEIVDEMYKHFNHDAKVLEPSAGTGNLIRNLPNVTAIEIATLHCKILQSKGIKTINADFMKYRNSELFDVVLMNPPYSKGRALGHINHAVKFLKDTGYILAVLPAGKVKAIEQRYEVIKTFEGVFDNTNIDTTLVKIYKD